MNPNHPPLISAEHTKYTVRHCKGGVKAGQKLNFKQGSNYVIRELFCSNYMMPGCQAQTSIANLNRNSGDSLQTRADSPAKAYRGLAPADNTKQNIR